MGARSRSASKRKARTQAPPRRATSPLPEVAALAPAPEPPRSPAPALAPKRNPLVAVALGASLLLALVLSQRRFTTPALAARARPAPVAAPTAPVAPALVVAPTAPVALAAPPLRYFRGQLHAHTANSSDSVTPPEAVVRWYAARGYDFLLLTDHNFITRVEPEGDRMLVLPGAELTRGAARCDRGTSDARACLVHVNALFVREGEPARVVMPPPATPQSLALYEQSVALAGSLGALALLNHPNFQHTANASVVTALASRGLRFLEVMNHAIDAPGGAGSRAPSPELLWDAALTAGHTLWGVASDDAHSYPGQPSVRGRRAPTAGEARLTGDHGFVMVAAPERTAGALREALERGRFYSSTGVLLERAGREDNALVVRVAQGSPPGEYRVDFVGSGGARLATVPGPEARFELARLGPGGYVRAVVYGPRDARAWVQPVRNHTSAP